MTIGRKDICCQRLATGRALLTAEANEIDTKENNVLVICLWPFGRRAAFPASVSAAKSPLMRLRPSGGLLPRKQLQKTGSAGSPDPGRPPCEGHAVNASQLFPISDDLSERPLKLTCSHRSLPPSPSGNVLFL